MTVCTSREQFYIDFNKNHKVPHQLKVCGQFMALVTAINLCFDDICRSQAHLGYTLINAVIYCNKAFPFYSKSNMIQIKRNSIFLAISKIENKHYSEFPTHPSQKFCHKIKEGNSNNNTVAIYSVAYVGKENIYKELLRIKCAFIMEHSMENPNKTEN